jgi:hypothetical protein
MGLFDSFKKKVTTEDSDNGIPGPTFLEGKVKLVENPVKLLSHEWRRKLQLDNHLFKIRYYGALHEEYKTVIAGTDFAAPLVIAMEMGTGKEVVLFDGCKHGYNAMFCYTNTPEQLARKADKFYIDAEGNDAFEITISTYYGIDYDEEFSKLVNKEGKLELVNGEWVSFGAVKRNGYDGIQIRLTNKAGKSFLIISEELA